MTITKEISLERFEGWSGAEDTLNRVINAGLCNSLEAILEELYPDGLDETTLNDLLRFDDEWIYETLGMKTESQIQEEIDDKQEEIDGYNQDIIDLLEEMNQELEDTEDEEDAQDIREDYEGQIEDVREMIKDLQEEIEELKEELAEI